MFTHYPFPFLFGTSLPNFNLNMTHTSVLKILCISTCARVYIDVCIVYIHIYMDSYKRSRRLSDLSFGTVTVTHVNHEYRTRYFGFPLLSTKEFLYRPTSRPRVFRILLRSYRTIRSFIPSWVFTTSVRWILGRTFCLNL